jgi:TonB-linked SusC/RagA family outer membrane protein
MRKLSLLTTLFLLTSVATGFAQQRTIRGRVTDDITGEPISFPQLTVQGTAAMGRARGATSVGIVGGEDGVYLLSGVPNAAFVLLVQRIGYRSASVSVSAGQDEVDVSLQVDYLNVEALVVTGRATETRRANLPNSIGTVSGEEIQRVPNVTVDAAIVGRVSGAIISSNSGAPGGGLQLEIRGPSSINAASDPLYVVDGVIVSNVAIPSNANVITAAGSGSNPSLAQDNLQNRISDINPEDIESIEVLKGAASAAIYGAKAANGVVIITTRRGGTGTPSLRLGFTGGAYSLSNTLGARAFESPEEAVAQWGPAAADFCPSSPCPFFDNEEALAHRKDFSWQGQASVSGGDPQTFSYFGSLLWRDDAGIIDNTGFQRQSARANLTPIVDGSFEMAINMNVLHTNAQRGLTNNDNNNVSYYMVFPFSPSFFDLSRQEDGSFPFADFQGNGSNPLQTAALLENDEDAWRYIFSTIIDWRLLDNDKHTFQIVAPFGFDYFLQNNRIFSPPEIFWEPADGLAGTVLQSNSENTNLNVGANGVWDWNINSGLRLTTAFGAGYERVALTIDRIIGRNLTGGKNKADAATQVQIRENQVLIEDFGFYIQEELLALDDKLLLGGSLRWDQSSANANTTKLFMFPKGYVSYRFANLGDAISEVKIRAAYGQSGNRPQCTALDGCQKFTSLTLDSNVEAIPGFQIQGQLGAPDLQPERTAEFEFGADITGWDGRLTLELTGYTQNITDLILDQTVAPSTGFTSQVFNGGSMRSYGFETTLGVTPFVGQSFTWISRTTFFLNRTEVTDLPIPPYRPASAGFGFSLGTFYIEEGSSLTQQVGTDPNCVGLGDPNPNCAQGAGLARLGNSNPDFVMAFANDFTIAKNVNFYSLLEWRQGQTIVNLTEFLYDLALNTQDNGVGQPVRPIEECNPNCTGVERLAAFGQGFAAQWVQPASFMKVRELALTWDLPIRSGTFRSIQLTVAGRNLWTVTNYRGLDPEVSNFGSRAVGRSIDVAPFPPSRSFWAGFNVSM